MQVSFGTPHPSNPLLHNAQLTQFVLNEVRKRARERNLKVASRSQVGGRYGTDVFICCNSNVMKDLILEVLRDEGIAVTEIK